MTKDDGMSINNPESSAVHAYRPHASSSLEELMHYGQMAETGVFKKFDYANNNENIAHYGTAVPPTLKLENIKNVPLAFFVGTEDVWADPTDVKSFKSKFSTLKFFKEYSGYGHSSFLIAKNMVHMPDAINFLKTSGNQPAASVADLPAESFIQWLIPNIENELTTAVIL